MLSHGELENQWTGIASLVFMHHGANGEIAPSLDEKGQIKPQSSVRHLS
jgi:hypothetical protein